LTFAAETLKIQVVVSPYGSPVGLACGFTHGLFFCSAVKDNDLKIKWSQAGHNQLSENIGQLKSTSFTKSFSGGSRSVSHRRESPFLRLYYNKMLQLVVVHCNKLHASIVVAK
jgi:hypothetical protein